MALVRPLRIGIVFETHDTYTRRPGDPDDFAVEYEPLETVEVLEAAFELLGHRPIRLGSPADLLVSSGQGALPALDAALSIAEGHGSRNREAWAPALLEMAGVPTLGSDGLTLSLTLDKGWANRWVAAAGVAVAPQCLMDSPEEAREGGLPAPFPLFVKPRWEGTAKGIRATSRVTDRESLAREVARIVADYDQSALVEQFVAGPEFTVTVVGHDPARPLPVVQRALERESGIGFHALHGPGRPSGDALEPVTPGVLTGALEARLQAQALRVFEVFACRDFARVDFRLDAAGEPVFLEVNPLPTFAPDGTFGILAELEGRSLAALLADVFGDALARLGLRTAPARRARA